MVTLVLLLPGCLTGEAGEGQAGAVFPNHVGCQLMFPDGSSTDCNGTADAFEVVDTPLPWLCAWTFAGGGYQGWLLNSVTLEYGAIRIQGDAQPPPNATIAVTFDLGAAAAQTYVGPWTDRHQLFVFPRPLQGEGMVFILGSAVVNATVDGHLVAVTTNWGAYGGVPAPVTVLEWKDASYAFHAFTTWRFGTASLTVPAPSFSITDDSTFTVLRTVPIQVGVYVGGVSWGPTGCVDGQAGRLQG
jgi:hypothetical protein